MGPISIGRSAAALVLSLWVAQVSLAEIPQTSSFQGVLTDPNGNAVLDGQEVLTFSLYTTPAGGTPIWEEVHGNVPVQDGVFDVILGSMLPLNLPFDQTYYLGITVATDDELSPRIELTPTPYALIAKTVEDGAITTAKLLDDAVTPEKISTDIVSRVAQGNAITVLNPTGPTATVAVSNNSINDDEIQDNSLTAGSLAPDSVGNSEIQNNAVTTPKIAPDVISSIDGVSNDGGNINLLAGVSVTITPNDAANTITIAAPGGIKQVSQGNAITVTNATGPTTTVAVTGNSINDDEIQDNSLTALSLATNSVGNVEIQNNAVTTSKILPDIVSSVDGVSNDGGNINLIGGQNITITPNDTANTITIAQTAGILQINAGNAINVTGGTGPIATVAVANKSIGTNELEAQVDLTPAGILRIRDGSGNERVRLSTSPATGGAIARFMGPSGFETVSIEAFTDDGRLLMLNGAQTEGVRLQAFAAGGSLDIKNVSGSSIVKLGPSLNDGGILQIKNASGAARALIGQTNAGGGILEVRNTVGSIVSLLTHDGSNNGLLTIDNAAGTEIARLDGDDFGNGVLTIRNKDGQQVAALRANDGDDGLFVTNTADGDRAITLTTGFGDPAGTLVVHDSTGTQVITLDGATATVFAAAFITTGAASARMQHPLEPDKEIYYASLEGPEAAVYVRGTAQLVSGEATVQLPDHFSLVAIDEGLTVQLTPLSGSSEGLAVVSKSTEEVHVRELRNGSGTYAFDYVVHAVRDGFEDFLVIRAKTYAQAAVALAPPSFEAQPEASGALAPQSSPPNDR